MHYLKRSRRDADPSDSLRREQERNIQRSRGTKYTFASFASVAACLAVMKAVNPDLPLTSPVLVFASVVMACLIMLFVARKRK